MANLLPKLGPFEPLYRLGAGGMAETFVAVRRGPGGFEQRVCIKRILPAHAKDQGFVSSFLAEARMSATLRHMNIVQVLDFARSEQDGSHYLVLELVDGVDLRGLLKAGVEFDPELWALVAAELATALEHAHAGEGGRPAVVHRDISPSNVLVSRAGEIKLTDFGIARVLGTARRTATGVIKGKVPYMPPEYIDRGHFDARGDLFSLGVLLYELAHGDRPFDDRSDVETMRRITSGERRPFVARAPRALVACVDRLLAHDPEERFASAHALLDALPAVPVNRTRKRLAELVRTHAPERSERGRSVRENAIRPTVRLSDLPRPRPSSTPTRTLPPRRPGPSRTAWLALALALVVLFVVAGIAVWRFQLQRAGASPRARSAPSPAPLKRSPGDDLRRVTEP